MKFLTKKYIPNIFKLTEIYLVSMSSNGLPLNHCCTLIDFGQRKHSQTFAYEQLPFDHKEKHFHDHDADVHGRGLEPTEPEIG